MDQDVNLDMDQLANKFKQTAGASITNKAGDAFGQGKFSEGEVTRNKTNSMTEFDTKLLGVPRQLTSPVTRYGTSPQSNNWTLQSKKQLPGQPSPRPMKQTSSFPTKLCAPRFDLQEGRRSIKRVRLIKSDSKNSKLSSALIGSNAIRHSIDNEKAFPYSDSRQVRLLSSFHINITDGFSAIVIGSVPIY